jgi:hypothetical protein
LDANESIIANAKEIVSTHRVSDAQPDGKKWKTAKDAEDAKSQ